MAGFAVTLHGRIWVSPEAPPKIASRARIPSVLVSTSIQARDRLFYGERLTVSFWLF
jgi:hypothetical protein